MNGWLLAAALAEAVRDATVGDHVAVAVVLERRFPDRHQHDVEKRLKSFCFRMLKLLMESMLMSSSCFTVFAGMVLPRAFGEHMRARACVCVRRVPYWRGVAGHHAATTGIHSQNKRTFFKKGPANIHK